MEKHFFLFFWSFIVLAIFCFLLFTPSGSEWAQGEIIEEPAFFIHTELSVKAKSRDEIIATVTLQNDTTVPYWLFPAVIPSDNPAMGVFAISYPGAGDWLAYTGRLRGNFVFWAGDFPDPFPMNSEEWIVLQPGESRSWSCNLARQYDFDALLDRGVDSFKVAYMANNPYWPNGHYVGFVERPFRWERPMYHMLGFGAVTWRDSVFKWKWIRVPRY